MDSLLKLDDEYYYNDYFIKSIKEAKTFKSRKKKISKIAFFYHRLYNGGVERVISLLSPMISQCGYKVYIILEEKNRDLDYVLPDDIEIELVAYGDEFIKDTYYNHAKSLDCVIQEKEIDLVMYEASSSQFFPYDSLLFQSHGAFVVTTCHEIFCQDMSLFQERCAKKMHFLRMADMVHTLNDMETRFWNMLGIPAKYIPNPLTFDPAECSISKLNNHSILWVGRLENNQKCYNELLKIMNEVKQKVPDAILYMVGTSGSKEKDLEIQRQIDNCGLNQNIRMEGYSNNPKSYYNKASLYLCVSEYETFPMSLTEAMCFGLPIISYSMPYLKISDSSGFISVEQKNYLDCSNTVVNLLDDAEKRKILGKMNRQYIENLCCVDIKNEWSELYNSLLDESNKTIESVDKVMMDTLFFHYTQGCRRVKREINYLRDRETKKFDNTQIERINGQFNLRRFIISSYRLCRSKGIKWCIIEAINRLNTPRT